MPATRENILEVPAYATVDAARYLRVPYQTLRYWVKGHGAIEPIVKLAGDHPPRLSFINLLECHMLSAMRTHYNLRLPKVRKALKTLAERFPSAHPLVDQKLETNRIDLYLRHFSEGLINLSRPDQREFRDFFGMHMQRIDWGAEGVGVFYPFIEKRSIDEPKSIAISPAISFGRPVISGTGIPTAVIASRFHARESVGELAKEHGRSHKEIEEAIRWESRSIAA
jgi:uncharacterized protein (DUF433 family)